MKDAFSILRRCGIRPTPQRIAVVEYIPATKAHSPADEVLAHVQRSRPAMSRATVYNTLNLPVEKSLVTTQILREGTVIFDPVVTKHHHFVDEESGKIYDVPWDALRVAGASALKEYEVRQFQVVLRGRRRDR